MVPCYKNCQLCGNFIWDSGRLEITHSSSASSGCRYCNTYNPFPCASTLCLSSPEKVKENKKNWKKNIYKQHLKRKQKKFPWEQVKAKDGRENK